MSKASYNHTAQALADLDRAKVLLDDNATNTIHRALRLLVGVLEAQNSGDRIYFINPDTGRDREVFFL